MNNIFGNNICKICKYPENILYPHYKCQIKKYKDALELIVENNGSTLKRGAESIAREALEYD
jgi:hypothetical protein